MNAPALENLEKEKKLLENLEKEKELLERFCLFFFAKEKEKSTKDGKMIEFNLRDGSRLVVFGKSAGYMPGEFVKKSLEGVCGVIESVGEINPSREYIPGKFFYGENLNEEQVKIFISDIKDFTILTI